MLYKNLYCGALFSWDALLLSSLIWNSQLYANLHSLYAGDMDQKIENAHKVSAFREKATSSSTELEFIVCL